jgi:predicted DNA-binding transcriptional regulator AlpA
MSLRLNLPAKGTPAAAVDLSLAVPPALLLAIDDVCRIVGMSKSMVFALTARNEFPSPVRRGPRWTRWRANEVVAWVEAL